jgi:hypothetical protein
MLGDDYSWILIVYVKRNKNKQTKPRDPTW